MDSVFIDGLTIKTDDQPTDIETLLQKRNELTSQINEAKALLKRLSEELVAINNLIPKDEELIPLELGRPTITKSTSTPQEKATFLFDLFHGRSDVYAQRIILSSGKAVYTPVCTNFFKDGCPKKAKKENSNKTIINCTSCPNKSFAPLTPEVILNNQLRNNNPDAKYAIGIYTTADDNTCHFLAIDFDEST